MVLRAGYYEFNFGQPDPDLLPIEAMRRAPAAALHAFGADMLAYGAPEGAWPLLGWIRDRIAALPMSASGWKRIFLGSAMDVEIDGSSRVLISPELRAAAGLTRDVMLLGMGSHFELWDAQRHAAHEAEVMQQGMPEVLKDFTF